MAQYLGMQVQDYDRSSLALSIDLTPSLNDKMTAWGGSLYGLAVMNCWGMFYLQCRERGINPNLVVSHGDIDYLAPVDQAVIVSRCDAGDIDWEGVFKRVEQRGKATVSLTARINNNGSMAVNFNGRYTLLGVKD